MSSVAPPPAPTAAVAFKRLRVHVIFSADESGTRRESDLTQMLLLGSGSASILPLVCVSHRIHFDRIASSVQTYAKQVRVFFDQRLLAGFAITTVAAAAAADDDDDDDEDDTTTAATTTRRSGKRRRRSASTQQQKIAQYNMFNMLNLFFPTSIPSMGALFASSPAPPPPLVNLSWRPSRPKFSYLFAAAAGAPTSGGRCSRNGHRLRSSSTRRRSGVRVAPPLGGGGGSTRRPRPHRPWHSSSRSSRSRSGNSSYLLALRRRRRRRRTHGGAGEEEAEAAAAATKRASSTAKDTRFFTVFRTTWLNDALNHPVYADMINAIVRYHAWYEETFKPRHAAFATESMRFFERIVPYSKGLRVGLQLSNALRSLLKSVDNITDPTDENEYPDKDKFVVDPQTRRTDDASLNLYKAIMDMRRYRLSDYALDKVAQEQEEQQQLAATTAYVAAARARFSKSPYGALQRRLAMAQQQQQPNNDAEVQRLRQELDGLATEEEAVKHVRQDKLHQAMQMLRGAQRSLEAVRGVSVGDERVKTLAATIEALKPLLDAYQPVEVEIDAFEALRTMDWQYASLPNGAGAYVAKAFPPFVELVGTLQQFARSYLSSNPTWHMFITAMSTQNGARTAFKAMANKCTLLINTGGRGAGAAELLPLGLDEVITAGMRGGGAEPPLAATAPPPTAAAAAAPQSMASARYSSLPILDAYIQTDVIGFVVGPENKSSMLCGFNDFLLGVKYDALMRPPPGWQIGARLFYP